MPIGEQTTIASHTGNGVATVFAYSFGVLAADDIKVLVDGVEVTTGFTVSGIGSRTGGTVTFSVAPTSGADILIVREVVRKRDTDYQYSGDLREEVLDDDLDRIWMTLQEDGELVDRGVRVPVGETLSELPAAASRVDKVLTFGSGGAIALVDVAAFSGGGVVELVPADGSIALVKLTTAVQNLINGALQRSGGTMTGKIVLDGDATLALHPVPKQQLDATVRADLSPLSVTVSGNALTCALPAEGLTFRSTTLNDGAVFSRTASATSLTVPDGATLGTANGVAARIAWGWIDNAGTPEPFVVNVGGTANLDETTLISTTAISGAANSVNTFYSQTARANVAFRIRGWCDITEATAGTWATAPTKVQGCGGLAGPGLGIGDARSWQAVTRVGGTTYFNTTGSLLPLRVHGFTSGDNYTGIVYISFNGGANIVLAAGGGSAAPQTLVTGSIEIPVGASYTLTYSNIAGGVVNHELR